MAIKFGGDFVVQRPRDEVYAFFTDPQRFAPLLPDYQSMAQQDATHFTVKVKVGISHIRGTAEVRMELAEAGPPSRAVYKGTGNVAGGGAVVTAGFDLQEQDGGTKVNWAGEAQIFGKLTSIAGGLLEPLAKKNVEKLITGLRQALSPGQQPPAETGPTVAPVSNATPQPAPSDAPQLSPNVEPRADSNVTPQ
jgi:carbon monoxide dehydrogenase subunit G